MDEVVAIFLGFVCGLPLGIVAGWIAAQMLIPRSSTVVVERSEHGYVIHER